MRINCSRCDKGVEIDEGQELSEVQCRHCGLLIDISPDDTIDFLPQGPPAPEDFIPERIGRFQILDKLGTGALGLVCKARDDNLDREVALKLPLGPIGTERTEQFKREATTVAKLHHPNIVGVYDAGIEDGQTYISSEYIEGKPLTRWANQEPVKSRDAARICTLIADALEHAHSRGVVHRDLKPSNIMIDGDGEPHVLDFGLATGASVDSPALDGFVIGTPNYMSPEQASGKVREVDSRTDIYSLGVILYELITAEKPIHGGALLDRIGSEVPQPPSKIQPDIPADLEAICLRCLEKDPDQRYLTARELRQDLRRFLAGEPLAGYRPTRWQIVKRYVLEQLTPFGVVALILAIVAIMPISDPWHRAMLAAVVASATVPVWIWLGAGKVPVWVSGGRTRVVMVEAQVQKLASQCEALETELDDAARMLYSGQHAYKVYQSLVESLPLGAFRKDLDGRFLFANEQFCSIAGRSADEIENLKGADIFSVDLAQQQQKHETSVIEHREINHSVERLTREDQELVFEVVRSPVQNFEGETIGVQGLMWDVSSRTRAEETLLEAKEAAEAANQAKMNFLANTSHEIRTPLASILELTEIVLESPLSLEQREHLTLVRESGETLVRIIDDLLDLSKIDAEKLELTNTPFELRYELESTIKPLSFATTDDVNVTLNVDDLVPRILVGDATRLRQVIYNLVGNAIRFTKQGTVDIDVSVERNEGDLLVLHFVVTDTGIGIPQDMIDEVFGPFAQADSSSTRRYGGTGLGLSIAKGIVRLFNGDIWCTSVQGKGSVFHFTCQFEMAPDQDIELHREVASTIETESEPRPLSLRVLVVDDVRANQLFVQYKLTKEGHRVVVADSGAEACARVSQEAFDLILMDVQMPDIDGYEATRRIRELESTTDSRTPIIAMTAHAMKGVKEQCLQAGMDDYVSKPISWFLLLDAIRRHAPSATTNPSITTHSELLEIAGGDSVLLSRLLKLFIANAPAYLKDIRRCYEARECQTLADACHKLKGALSNLLRDKMFPEVLNLEEWARQEKLEMCGQELDNLEHKMNRLRDDLTRTLEELEDEDSDCR